MSGMVFSWMSFFADYFFGGLNGKIKKLKRGAENEHKKE